MIIYENHHSDPNITTKKLKRLQNILLLRENKKLPLVGVFYKGARSWDRTKDLSSISRML